MATPLRIGVLIVPPIQLLDIAPIDLFAMLSRSYFEDCKMPQPLLDLAIPDSDLSITYIAHTRPSSSSSSSNSTQNQKLGPPAPTTAHLNLEITAGLSDPRVLPGQLDILLIPGPPPGMHIPEVVCQFVRGHVEKGVDLLTVCTGIFVAAEAGVSNGKTATGSRGVIDVLEKKYQAVKWVDARWSVDGRVWTSGGITNGMDMVATYLKHRFPGPLSDTVIKLADVEIRPVQYGQRKGVFTASFVWLILRAWVAGLVGGSKGKGKAN